MTQPVPDFQITLHRGQVQMLLALSEADKKS